MPYLEVVKAAGWFLLLSKGVESSSPNLRPTWNDWNASENSLTGTKRYGSSLRAQYCCWSFLDVTYWLECFWWLCILQVKCEVCLGPLWPSFWNKKLWESGVWLTKCRKLGMLGSWNELLPKADAPICSFCFYTLMKKLHVLLLTAPLEKHFWSSFMVCDNHFIIHSRC